MPNSWLNVLTGFNQSYNRGAQNYEDQQNELQRQKFQSQEEKQRQEDEFQRQKDLFNWENQIKTGEANQQQNDIQGKLSSLLSGKNTNVSNTPGQSLTIPGVPGNLSLPKVSPTDMTPQDKMRTLLGLPASVQNEYQKYQKQQEDQAQDDLLKSAFNETDPEKIKSILPQLTTDNLKRYSEMKSAVKQPKPESVSLGHETDYKANRIIERKGYLNPNADPKDPSTKIIDGKKYTVTSESSMGKAFKTADNGKKDFANATKTVYKDWETSLEKMNFRLQNNTDEKGNPLTQTDKDQREKDRAEYQARFAEKVKKEMPKSVKDWYENQFNAAKKQGLSIDAQTFWVRVKKTYENGDFSKNKDEENLAMRYLRELHYATYSEDPAKKYAGFSSDDDNDEDEDNE